MPGGLVSVKGEMSVNKWGPFSFSLIGQNPEERKKIADFVKIYYERQEYKVPNYRGFEQADFHACTYLTLNRKKPEVQIGIMPPNTSLRGLDFEPENPKKISVKGKFYCQYCGPLNFVLVGSNDAEQKKMADWLRSYLEPNHQPEYFEIQDLFGRGCLTIWFSNKDQTEADIKVTVFPSLKFMKSVKDI